MAVIVRKARLRDVPAITRLWKELMEHHRKKLGYGRGIFQYRKGMAGIYVRFLKKKIRARNAAVFVAEAGGKAIGHVMVSIQKRPAIYVHDSEAYIGEIFVDNRFRGRGTGSLLLKEAERWAKSKGSYSLGLNLSTDNLDALRLYERFGFVAHHSKMNKIIR
jgi:ribosomal protein S18 acetylase RimI-like enzyme